MKTTETRPFFLVAKKAIYSFCFVVFFSSSGLAYETAETATFSESTQIETPIQGKITDEDNVGLPGASVVIKGTAQGVITDYDGNFSLDAPDDAVLVISYLGYKTQEIIVGTQTEFIIQMIFDANSLDEVVVVGYGSQRKKDLTGAVSSIKAADIVRGNPVQAANALQGQVAGVNITRINGRPGSSFDITVRGVSNFDENNEGLNDPLIVIDGVMGGNMDNLNPADIASMDVLKDASSTAIYGSRGANGVIIITTHKGTSGKPKITFNSYVGAKVPTHVPKMMTAQQFYEAYNTTRQADALAIGISAPKPRGWTESEVANAENGRTTDWIDLVTGPALQTSQTLSVTGGTDNTRYNFSAGYLDESGNSTGSGYKRYTINAGLESEIHNKITIGFTSYSSFSDRSLPTSELLRSAYRARPTGTVKFDDLAPADQANDLNLKGNAFFMGIDDNQVFNTLVEVDPENARHETKVASILANGFIEFRPVTGLSLRSSISAAVSNDRDGEYWGNYTKTQRGTRGNRARYMTDNRASYTLDNIITYKRRSGAHDLKITGLQSAFQQRDEASSISVQALPYRSLWHNLGTGEITGFETDLQERSLLSYMGRVNYSFADKYLVTFTGRSDGASQLSEGNKWIFYPSVAVAWRLGEEDFIKNSNLFSDLKLRASYGLVGNASSVRPYDTQANITQTNYDFGGASAPGFAIGALANKNLVYEKSRELNIGLNIGFLNNRISGEIEVYDRTTIDLIVGDKVPTSTGFTDVVANVGEIRNRGVELTLNTVNIATNNLRWSTTLTFTKNKDEVTKLAGGITEDIGNLRFVGESVFPFYSWVFDGIWQLDQAEEAAGFGQLPGQVRLKDLNGDGEITDDDRTIVGKGTPDFIAGMRNKVNYGNFDLSFFVYTRQGLMYNNQYLRGTFGDVGSDRYNRSAEIDVWTSTNPSNTYFGFNGPGLSSHPVRGNTRVALQNQEANFIRISDITLGYSVPRSGLDRLGFSNLRFYAQANNPFVFTDFLGFNPEYNSSVSNDDLPFASYLFGLNVSF